MLKNLKYIAILSIATLYVLQLCFVFLGTLVEHIQQTRHQNQITKTLLAEHKVFSLQDWQKLDNKKEIEINSIFYDVIYFKIISKKVQVNVVKDNFESELRISLQNLFNKKKASHSDKKKHFNSYNYLTILGKENPHYFPPLLNFFSKPSLLFSHGKTNKIIESIYRPPC